MAQVEREDANNRQEFSVYRRKRCLRYLRKLPSRNERERGWIGDVQLNQICFYFSDVTCVLGGTVLQSDSHARGLTTAYESFLPVTVRTLAPWLPCDNVSRSRDVAARFEGEKIVCEQETIV